MTGLGAQYPCLFFSESGYVESGIPTQHPEVQHTKYVFPTAQGLVSSSSSSIVNHFAIAPGQAMTSKPYQSSRIFNQCNVIKMFY
jgi:hypothetical protein